MNREQILAILYEMALVIGGDVKLLPLLTKTLQRLLFHTSFPCGMIFLDTETIRSGEAAGESAEVRLALSIGDLDLAERNGTIIRVPAIVLRGGMELAEGGELLNAIPCRRDYYRVFLRLPIDECGVILLLAPRMPETDLPLTRIFQPVMSNLAKAIQLCRSHEAYTERLLTDQRLAEAALKDMSYRNRLILDSVGEGICGQDLDGNTTFVNPAAARILGFEPGELAGRGLHDILHHRHCGDGTPGQCPIIGTLRYGRQKRIADDLFTRRDGTAFPAEYVSTPLMEEGRIVGSVLVFQDITERKQAEGALHRLNRELRAISDCNQALMRAEDEQTLLSDVCRIVCDKAGYRMAWVGYAENDDARTVRPVAWAGVEDSYLANARITWADVERGRGPTGIAIRTGKTDCIQDFSTEPKAAPWRDSALQRGYRSSISLPLKDESKNTFGALTIYSSEPHAFTADEVRLLEELAGDLAFGIVVLRARIRRKETEQQLENQHALLTAILNSSRDIIVFSLDKNYCYTSFNEKHREEMQKVWGADIQIGMNLLDCMKLPELRELAKQSIDRALQGDMFTEIQHQPEPDIYYEFTWNPVVQAGSIVGATVFIRDITGRKRAEEALRESEHRYRDIFDNVLDGLYLLDVTKDGRFRTIEVNPALEQVTGIPRARSVGKTQEEIVPEEVARLVNAKYRRCVEAGRPIEEEVEMELPSGRRVFHSSLIPARDETGRVYRIIGISRDITARKLAEEEIHKLNNALEQRVKERTAELEQKNRELERMNRLFVGRELRMKELKERIGELEGKSGGA